MVKLIIVFVIVEGDYGHTIFYLVGKGVDWIIYQYDVGKRSIPNDAQVLHVVSLWCPVAVVSVEAELKILSLWIDIVKYCICISLMWSSEDSHLEVQIGYFQALPKEGSEVNGSL